jgi:hypothetical protein
MRRAIPAGLSPARLNVMSNTITTTRTRTATPVAAAATLLAALAYLVLSGIQIMNPAFDDYLTKPIDYLNDGSFFVGLTASMAGVWALVHVVSAPRGAAALTIAGQALVAVGVGFGLATGQSPDWFGVVGLPGNLLAWAGMIWLAVWAWRSRGLPRWTVPLLALAVPLGVGVAEYGFTVVTGALWCAVGAHLLRLTTSDA